MTDADANKLINRVTAHADRAFESAAEALEARDLAKSAVDSFAAIQHAGFAARSAMRVELSERAAREVANGIPLDSDWRPVAKLVVDRIKANTRAARLAAVEALDVVRSKPLGRESAAGGAL